MGTFKHIGRLRTARLIGKELASFYLYVLDAGYLCSRYIDLYSVCYI